MGDKTLISSAFLLLSNNIFSLHLKYNNVKLIQLLIFLKVKYFIVLFGLNTKLKESNGVSI